MATVRSLSFGIGFKIFDNDLIKADKQVTDLKNNLTGVESELTDVGKEAEKTGNKIDDSMKKGSKSSKGFISSLEDNKGALLGVWTGLTAGIGFSVKAAADFESQMIRVGQVSQASNEELTLLENTAKSLSLDTAFSPKKIAEGQEYLAMAGFSVKENISALPDVLNLAAASQMDLGRASDIASDILTGFGYEAQDMTRVVDALQATASGANTNVSMLGESMKYVGPVAQNLGYDIETMSSALGLMANAGIKGGQAGRYLRTGLTRLASPTDDALGKMNELGIEITDSQGELLGFTDIVKEFETELDGMSSAQKQAALTTIFGQEAATGFLAIINQGSDELVDFRTELYKSVGITEQMAEKQMESLTGSFQKLWGSVSLAAITIGEKFSPVIQLTTDVITGLVNLFIKLPSPIQTGIAVVLGLTTALIGVATAVGFLVGPITTAATALGLYTPAALAAEGATVGWNLALLANPITGTIAGIIALGVAIWGVVKHWDVITEKTTQFFGWFKGKLEATPDWLQLLIAPITLIPEYWTEIKIGIGKFFGWFKTTLDKTPSWILAFTAPLLLIPKHWGAIKSATTNAVSAIGSGFAWLGNKTVEFGKNLWSLANKVPDLPGMFSMAKDNLTGLVNYVSQNPLSSLFRVVFPAINLIDVLNIGYSKARNWLAEHAGLELPEFKIPTIDDLFNSITEKIEWLQNKLANFDIGSTIKNGIESTKDTAIGAVKGMTQKVRNFLPFSPAKEGPLSDLDKTGPGLINTITTGINKAKGGLNNTLTGLWSRFDLPSITDFMDTKWGIDTPQLPNLKQVISTAWDIARPKIPGLGSEASFDKQDFNFGNSQESQSNVDNSNNQNINNENNQSKFNSIINKLIINIENKEDGGMDDETKVKLRDELGSIIYEAASAAGVV